MKKRRKRALHSRGKGRKAIPKVSVCIKEDETDFTNLQDSESPNSPTCCPIISSVYSLSADHEEGTHRQVQLEQNPDGEISGHEGITLLASFCVKEEEESYPIYHPDSERTESISSTTGLPVISSVYSLIPNHEEEANFPEKLEQEPEGNIAGHERTTSVASFCIKEEEESYPIRHPDRGRTESISSPTGHPVISGVYSLSLNQEETTHFPVKLEQEPGRKITECPLLNTDMHIKEEESNTSVMDHLAAVGSKRRISNSSGHRIISGLHSLIVNHKERRRFPVKLEEEPGGEITAGIPVISGVYSLTVNDVDRKDFPVKLEEEPGGKVTDVPLLNTDLHIKKEEASMTEYLDAESIPGTDVPLLNTDLIIKKEELNESLWDYVDAGGAESNPSSDVPLLNTDFLIKKEELNASLLDYVDAGGAESNPSSGHPIISGVYSLSVVDYVDRQHVPVKLEEEPGGKVTDVPLLNTDLHIKKEESNASLMEFLGAEGAESYPSSGHAVGASFPQFCLKEEDESYPILHPESERTESNSYPTGQAGAQECVSICIKEGDTSYYISRPSGHPIRSSVYPPSADNVEGTNSLQKPERQVAGDKRIRRTKKGVSSKSRGRSRLYKMIPTYHISINQHDYLASPLPSFIISKRKYASFVMPETDNSDIVLKRGSMSDTEEHDERWTQNSSIPSPSEARASDTQDNTRISQNSSASSALDTYGHERATQTSPVSSASGTEDIGKRFYHNLLERKRRTSLYLSFCALRDEIPELVNKERAAKVAILNKARHYMLHIQTLEQQLIAKIEFLKQERKYLECKLEQLSDEQKFPPKRRKQKKENDASPVGKIEFLDKMCNPPDKNVQT